MSGVPSLADTLSFNPRPMAVGGLEGPFDGEADVLVIGFGGAGACAALAAREAGAEVIVADRFGGGGATAYSGGVIYAGGTTYQRSAGFHDTPEAMFDYLSMEIGDAVKPETLKRFCHGSASDVAWLEAQGLEFSGEAITIKTAYPPDNKFLYFSGNEKLKRYRERAKPAPRGHRTVGTGWTGYRFYDGLSSAVERSGARVMRHMFAQRLILEGERVCGVEFLSIPPSQHAAHAALSAAVSPLAPFKAAENERRLADIRAFEAAHGVTSRIYARKGVVLSTGGFTYNLEMIRRFRPILADNYEALLRLGSAGCDGSGIAIGEAAGGSTRLMESAFVSRLIAPPNGLLQGIIVNANAERFFNEEAYCGFLGDAIARQTKGEAWIILDAKGFRTVIRQCLNFDRSLFKVYLLPTLLNILFGGGKRARSVGLLARKLGLDPSALERTVAQYNLGTQPAGRDAFDKSGENLRALGKGPYHAINASVTNKYGFTQLFTLGGLRVDEDTGLVLRADDSKIEGLYAAGRAAVGLCSIGYVSGMSLADAVFSGRRAGHCAASIMV